MNKNGNYFEIIVGTFVLLCAGFFLFGSVKGSKSDSSGKYSLVAKFDNIEGVSSGSDIKIAGVKIGTVSEQFLDPKTYRASLKLLINSDVKLPTDSSAKISSEGLLGSKFLSIEIGSDEENLKEGDEIVFTQSSVNFEELLGK
ncbi:MAG: outer membrane lipid asymmetry maintenance protein MlaD, partial [Pelagibacterales bacterium]|nr:outer membrane lipid asymmetry maintenance protein MlaD [Pelagibacterales bacterium]